MTGSILKQWYLLTKYKQHDLGFILGEILCIPVERGSGAERVGMEAERGA